MSEHIILSGRNLWIVDKKPQIITDIKYEDGMLQVGAEQFAIKEIYAALFCMVFAMFSAAPVEFLTAFVSLS